MKFLKSFFNSRFDDGIQLQTFGGTYCLCFGRFLGLLESEDAGSTLLQNVAKQYQSTMRNIRGDSFKTHLHNCTDDIIFIRTKKLPDADKTFTIFSNNFYRSAFSLFFEHVVTFRGLP